MNLEFSFDPPRARRRDPATSHAAADRAKDLAHQHHILILGALRQGSAGKDRIAKRAGLTSVAVARRMIELQRALAVADTGLTETSDSGRQERVWRLA